MAVVETIRIDGDSSQFDAAVKDLISGINQLNKSIDKIGTEAKQSFGQAETAVKGVKEEVKETGKSVQDLIKNITALGVITKLTDAASEAFTGNQKIVDTLNTGLFSAQILVSNLIDYFSGGGGSLADAFRGVTSQAKELVDLQNQSKLAEVERIRLQFEYQTLAEKARQLRDDELSSIDERISKNDLLNDILIEQLSEEGKMVQTKIAAAQAEVNRLDNIENQVALAQALTEEFDIQERILSQTSEYLSNQRGLERERLELQKQINERKAIEAETGVKQRDDEQAQDMVIYSFKVRTERELAEMEYERYYNGYQVRKDFLLQQIQAAQDAGLTENAQYQTLLDEKYQLDVEYFERSRDLANQRREFNLQSLSDAVKTTGQAIDAISAFYEARYANDEENAEKAFNIQKKLSIAQAVVQGVESVVNAYATAQKSPLTTVFPAYPIVAAGAAAAFSASQVALISNQQFQSASAGGSSSYDSGAAVPSQPANFNIVSRSGNNILMESIASQFDKPMKAYVVSGEVISGTQLDRRRIRTATFG
jgi:hypothetical protein